MCPILKGWGSSIKRDGAERGREQNAFAEERTKPQRLLQRTDAEEELPHGHLGTLVKSDADRAHVSNSPPIHKKIKTDPIYVLNAHVVVLFTVHVARYSSEKQASIFFLNFNQNIAF